MRVSLVAVACVLLLNCDAGAFLALVTSPRSSSRSARQFEVQSATQLQAGLVDQGAGEGEASSATLAGVSQARGESVKKLLVGLATVLCSLSLGGAQAYARPEGVNRPDLLPAGPVTPLIDVGNFLTKGQERKVVDSLNRLEKNTGWKVRVLCQAYPQTPGLAIKDYWKVNDDTVVVVVDKGEGFNRKGIPSNIINLNIGKNVELVLPSQFWSRVTNKLGNQPYVKAVGADSAVLNTVEAITYCLEDKSCTDVPFDIPSQFGL